MDSGVGGDLSRAVSLTNFFVSLPRSRYQFLVLLFLTFIFSLFLYYIEPINFLQSLLTSFLLITVPATLSALLFRLSRGVMLKRSFFLMLVASLLYIVIYAIYFLTSSLNALIIGYSAVFIILLLISLSIFRLKYSGPILSLIQLFFFSVMLYYLEYLISSPKDLLLKLSVTSLIFAGFAYLVIYIINAPLKRAFSVSSSRAFSLFVSQWLYDSKDLEKEFDRIGVYSNTYIDALYIKNAQGACLISIPQVHFGPFGNLGGSNFPYLISRSLERSKDVDCSIVMHGACTHDYNPTTTAQLRNITIPLSSFVEESSNRMKRANLSFIKTSFKKAHASHLLLGKTLLSSFTRHPLTTEDMDFGLGLLLREIGSKLFDTVLIADEHNAETGEITQFLLGSQEAYEYTEAMRSLNQSVLKHAKSGPAKFAFSKFNKPGYKAYGIGENGISMFCFLSARNSVLYIIFDSNGITDDAMSRIRNGLGALFKEVVIMTTDTHALNKVSGIVNPVGSDDTAEIEAAIINEARNLLEEASPFTYNAKTLPAKAKVFGPRQSLKLIGTVNAIVSTTKLILPLLLLFGTLLALWALSLI